MLKKKHKQSHPPPTKFHFSFIKIVSFEIEYFFDKYFLHTGPLLICDVTNLKRNNLEVETNFRTKKRKIKHFLYEYSLYDI